jgi:hypothetical protein
MFGTHSFLLFNLSLDLQIGLNAVGTTCLIPRFNVVVTKSDSSLLNLSKSINVIGTVALFVGVQCRVEIIITVY